MAENSHYLIPQTSKFSVCLNDLYISARATRTGDPKQVVKSETLASSSRPKSQNHIRAQICEALRNCNNLTAPPQPRTRLPLNMVVSKPATRKPLQEKNADPMEGFDSSDIRSLKFLEPPWKEKEDNRKRLRSAYLHNKRKIEEIRAMKARLKCPRYDPGMNVQRRRCHDLRPLSESEPVLQREQVTTPEGRFSQLYDGCRRLHQTKPSVIESEDPLMDVSADKQTAFEEISNENENIVFNSTPTFRPIKDEFVWNPVIVPVSNLFSSARELLEYHYPPELKGNYARECFNSPGNQTTSSASSGLTVAEETVQLTYYAGRCGVPLNEQSRTRRSGNYSFQSDSSRTTVEDWLPRSLQPDFINYYEE